MKPTPTDSKGPDKCGEAGLHSSALFPQHHWQTYRCQVTPGHKMQGWILWIEIPCLKDSSGVTCGTEFSICTSFGRPPTVYCLGIRGNKRQRTLSRKVLRFPFLEKSRLLEVRSELERAGGRVMRPRKVPDPPSHQRRVHQPSFPPAPTLNASPSIQLLRVLPRRGPSFLLRMGWPSGEILAR